MSLSNFWRYQVVGCISALLSPRKTLQRMYEQHCAISSDIHEHLPTLRELAKTSSSVVEIGVRNVVSTWAFCLGLAESAEARGSKSTYLGIDLKYPKSSSKFQFLKTLARANQIQFDFWAKNDMEIQIPETDILFIDSLHTYCHLTYELNTFSSKVKRFIVLHDTSEPWGFTDDVVYHGDYSEYPPSIDRTKRGLWPAVEDFIKTHPEWVVHHRYENNSGLTVLKRVSK